MFEISNKQGIFCEAIGSKAEMIDTLFSDFKSRLKQAQKYNSKILKQQLLFIHLILYTLLTREVLNIAKDENLSVTAHF